jgi:hypothetical protein
MHLSLEMGEPMYPWGAGATYWGSGRDAMRAVLAWGKAHLGWRRLLCPSFMCQRVASALAMEIDLEAYPHRPTSTTRPALETGEGDVVLVIASLGARLEPIVSGPGHVIEDHSHDPLSAWADSSTSDFAVASLRKTFPLADGGVAWSPTGLDGPPERPVTDRHANATLERLSAMILKRLYLDGASVSKEDFRRLSMSGEADVAQGAISGISDLSRSRLASLPTVVWRAARIANLTAFREAFGQPPGTRLLEAPFAATLVFDEPSLRDQVRRSLISADIYPAVLWPLEERIVPGIGQTDIDLSRRILSIHCDQRYSTGEMERVARQVRNAVTSS